MNNSTTDLNWKKFAAIGKPFGVKGEFFLSCAVNLLKSKGTALLIGGSSPQKAKVAKILSHRVLKGRDILKLDLFPDRTAIEQNSGAAIWVQSDNTEHDAIGKVVRDCNDILVGEVIDQDNYGAGEIIKVKTPDDVFVDLPLLGVYFHLEPRQHELVMKVPIAMFSGLCYRPS